jgi:hypothetical protein
MHRFATHTWSANAAVPGIHDELDDNPFSDHHAGMIVFDRLIRVPSSGVISTRATISPGDGPISRRSRPI